MWVAQVAAEDRLSQVEDSCRSGIACLEAWVEAGCQADIRLLEAVKVATERRSCPEELAEAGHSVAEEDWGCR